MAADKINPLPSPSLERALGDRQTIEPRALDSIVIPRGPDVAHLEVVESDTVNRLIQKATVIEIETILRLPYNLQVAEREVRASGELKTRLSSLKYGWPRRIERLDCHPFDPTHLIPSRVVTGSDLDGAICLQIPDCRLQGRSISHHDFLGRDKTGEEEKQDHSHGLASPSGS